MPWVLSVSDTHSSWRYPSVRAFLLSCVAFMLLVTECLGEVYQVGPNEQLTSVSDIESRLQPGDVLEITGDLRESICLTQSGTPERPIVIRSAVKGSQTRARITAPKGAEYHVLCLGDWNVLEGLDIGGAQGDTFQTGSAVAYKCSNLILRNCRIHHSKQGVYGEHLAPGTITIEFCEFDSVGGVAKNGANLHGVYLTTTRRGALVTIQHCYFHDATGGSAFVKSRCARNVIRYNWFENAYTEAVRLVDTNVVEKQSDALYPMHSDILGNVFLMGWSPGGRFRALQLGGESELAAGTEGDFSVAHNLFVLTCGGNEPGAAIIIDGNVNRVSFYNNAVLYLGGRSGLLFERNDYQWNTPRTLAFAARRGSREPAIQGSHNWLSEGTRGVSGALKETAFGVNPRLRDLLRNDLRPRETSQLALRGARTIPRGGIIEMTPEYEPQRSIPADLTPRRRRAISPPSIGPFEVE